MKKSLLAVAVAAALPTFAQAQSSVTLFGILDASVEYSDSQANASTAPGTGQSFREGDAGFRLNSGLQSGSRVGIRGVEDIGGGLKGIFTLEHRLDLSTGETNGGNIFLVPGASNTSFNNKFWNGQAWVGLETPFGNITLGRQYSPLFWALLPADRTVYGFYNNWVGLSGTNLNGSSPQGAFRLDNSVAYKSPTMGGLTVYATYAFGENLSNNPGSSTAPGSDTTGSGDIWGVAAGWKLGGLYLAGGYHSFDVKRWAGATVSNGLKDVAAGTASYQFTNFGLSVGYSELNFELAASSPKLTNILLGGFANLGPGTLFVNATQLDASGFTGLRNDSGLQLGVAYSIPLSKRTNWYAAYGLNDVSGLQSSAPGTVLIDSANRFAIGVRHLF